MNWFGGPVMWVLVVCALAVVAMFVSRLAMFRRAHVHYEDFIHGVNNVLGEGHINEALMICEETNAPISRIVSEAIRCRDMTEEAMRENVDIVGKAEISRLERRLVAIVLIAQTAPLLGLLGTIYGFMRTLLVLNGGEPVSRVALTGGVMNALAAAAAGLIVSIMSHMMYGILKSRLDRIVVELESGASSIVAMMTSGKAAK